MTSPTGMLLSIAAAEQGGTRGVSLWAVDSGGLVWTLWQVTAGGAWSGWEGPGFKNQPVPMWQVAGAGQNNGMLVLLGLDRQGLVWSIAQWAPGGDWTAWSGPGIAAQPVPFACIAATQQAGGLGAALWGLDADGQIWFTSQPSPGGAWSAWQGPGFANQSVPMRRLAAADQGNGQIMLFGIDLNGSIWGVGQTDASGDWGSWGGPNFAGAPTDWIEIVALEGTGGSQLWALDPSGSVWTIYQTPPGAGWTSWIGPGFGGQPASVAGIAAGGQNDGLPMLFGVQPNGQPWSLSGTTGGTGWGNWTSLAEPASASSGWEQVGSNASQVLSAGSALFSVDATSGNVSQYSGIAGQWTQVGGPAFDYQGTEDALYRIVSDKSAVQQWDPAGLAWNAIGGAMAKLITARHRLHGLDPQGNGFMYSGTPNQWTALGGPFRDLDANDDYCFAVSLDGGSVAMAACGTTAWTQIGGAMDTVFATGAALYGVDAQGAVWLYSGTGTQWTQVGAGYSQLATFGSRLFALAADKSGVYEHRLDLAGAWQPVAGAADSIAAGDGYVAGVAGGAIVVHRDGQMPGAVSLEESAALRESVSDPEPPTNDYKWLFQFDTADQIAAGYDGSIRVTAVQGLTQQSVRLGGNAFERGKSYVFPIAQSALSQVAEFTNLNLQGEYHYLPDHWTLAALRIWDLDDDELTDFVVNQDIPNEGDHPPYVTVYPSTPMHAVPPPEPAYIYVWTATGMSKSVGHASLMLADEVTYISWWPEGGVTRKELLWTGIAYDAPHNHQQSYADDFDAEGKTAPDLMFPVWNVDTAAAESWFDLQDDNASLHWNLLDLNCSTMVYKALEAGGALASLSPGEAFEFSSIKIWTPNEIARLARLLQSKHVNSSSAPPRRA